MKCKTPSLVRSANPTCAVECSPFRSREITPITSPLRNFGSIFATWLKKPGGEDRAKVAQRRCYRSNFPRAKRTTFNRTCGVGAAHERWRLALHERFFAE